MQVSVELTEGGLRIHIQCEKRPRVLADIMDFLESSGMNVDQVSIAYQEDSQFVFDCLGSKVWPYVLENCVLPSPCKYVVFNVQWKC